MKLWHWLVLGVVAWVVLRNLRKTPTATATTVGQTYAPGNDIDTATLAKIDALAKPNNGFPGWKPLEVTIEPNQQAYPGWYHVGGGWVNPDTGQTYSEGSSPPALAVPLSVLHPLFIDLNAPGTGGHVTGTPEENANYFIA